VNAHSFVHANRPLNPRMAAGLPLQRLSPERDLARPPNVMGEVRVHVLPVSSVSVVYLSLRFYT